MKTMPEKFQHLLEANRILSSTLKLPELLRNIMQFATDVVEAESSSILLYNKKTNELVFDIALGNKEKELREIRLKLGEGVAGWVAKEKKTRIVNDVKDDSQWAKRADESIKFKTRSIVAVPLLYQNQLLGVVESVNKKNGEFVEEDAQILEAFAAQAAVAIENARLFENLEREKEKIEAVFSQMSDSAIFVDSKGNKILHNDSAKKLLGEENICKKSISEILSNFEITPNLVEVLERSDKFIEVELRRKEGQKFYLAGIVSRIMDEKNNVLGLIFVLKDVTEEKKENFLKKNFLSLISHKLKTPLVSIIGYGPMLLESDLDDFQKKAVASIGRQGAYLASLVDKLIYFTEAEGENLKLVKEEINVKFLVERAVSSIKQYLDQKNAEVVINKKIDNLENIWVDNEKIEVVIRNLVENAVKFNKSEKIKVEILPKKEKNMEGLEIRDNGPGIPSEEREKIFQKFYQIEETFTGQVEGAGLGLALVKQIIEAHKGKIGLESGIGKGSSFYFLLPV